MTKNQFEALHALTWVGTCKWHNTSIFWAFTTQVAFFYAKNSGFQMPPSKRRSCKMQDWWVCNSFLWLLGVPDEAKI
jgi:hypothetical protein